MAIDTTNERFGFIEELLPYPTGTVGNASRLVFLDLFGVYTEVTASDLRTIDLSSEDRSSNLDSESRTFAIEIESRTHSISAA